MRKTSVINVAYQYLKRGCPIPVDVQGDLIRAGISPTGLEREFERRNDFRCPTIRGTVSPNYFDDQEVHEVQARVTPFRDSFC